MPHARWTEAHMGGFGEVVDQAVRDAAEGERPIVVSNGVGRGRRAGRSGYFAAPHALGGASAAKYPTRHWGAA